MMNARVGRVVAVLSVTVALVACNGDDDAGPESTSPLTTEAEPATTEPATTVPATDPPTTARATTTSTEAPTTTLDVEALQAEIKADVERSFALRTELVRNPRLDGLDAALAQITAPGSESERDLRDFVTQMVELGQRVEPGVPDLATFTVEAVEVGASGTDAVVTVCIVNNQARVDSAGVIQPGTGILAASRVSQTVSQTTQGWLPASDITTIGEWPGGESCPPA